MNTHVPTFKSHDTPEEALAYWGQTDEGAPSIFLALSSILAHLAAQLVERATASFRRRVVDHTMWVDYQVLAMNLETTLRTRMETELHLLLVASVKTFSAHENPALEFLRYIASQEDSVWDTPILCRLILMAPQCFKDVYGQNILEMINTPDDPTRELLVGRLIRVVRRRINKVIKSQEQYRDPAHPLHLDQEGQIVKVRGYYSHYLNNLAELETYLRGD